MAIDPLKFLEQLQSDTDVMDEVSAYAPSRSRGAGARVSIGSSGGTAIPQMAAQFMGESQAQSEAADDGQSGPVAAKSHTLAYMDDPQWQHWDQMRAKAVNNMADGGGFWGWATGGRYNAALGQEAQNADYMARQIERRYLDEATVRAANTDRYDWTKPSRQAVYNPETGTYADEFTGTLGGKAMRPVDRPTQDMVTETGAVVSATRGPANQGWVTKGAALPSETKYINGSTEPSADGPFAGGVAESEESMPVIRDAKMLSENAKARSEVKRDEAAAKKDEALATAAENRGPKLTSHSPGSWVTDETGKVVLKVPQTASQSGANRGGGGAGRPLSVTAKLEQARKNALSAVPKNKEMEWNAAKLAEWQKAYDAKVAEELELIERMDSGAPSVGDAEPDNDYGARKPPAPSKGKSTESSITLGKDAGGYKKGARVKVRVYEDGSVDILGPAGK